MSERPYSLYGRPAAVPSADRKSAEVAHPPDLITADEEREAREAVMLRVEAAMWLSNQLGRPFPVEDVYPGHVANYLVWKRVYGR